MTSAYERESTEYIEEKINPRDLPFVRDALSAIDKGGYPEFVARVAAFLGKSAGVIPIRRVGYLNELVGSDEILSKLSSDEFRRILSEQSVIVEFEPQLAFENLPKLLSDRKDKIRAQKLLDSVKSNPLLNQQQKKIIEKIGSQIGNHLKISREKSTQEARSCSKIAG